MNPLLGCKAARAPNLSQLEDVFMGRRVVCPPLLFTVASLISYLLSEIIDCIASSRPFSERCVQSAPEILFSSSATALIRRLGWIDLFVYVLILPHILLM